MMGGMPGRESTCWTLVRGAAAGVPEDRAGFAQRYGPVIRAYLAARWRRPHDHHDVADAAQEVFLQCFKAGGALERLDPDRPGGFRAFLFGIARNVANDLDARRQRRREQDERPGFGTIPSDEQSLSGVFDRAWARMLMREARELIEHRSRGSKPEALRVEALRLRYESGMPSREIARAMKLEANVVYQMLTEARREFRGALLEVMASYHPQATRGELERLCLDQLRAL